MYVFNIKKANYFLELNKKVLWNKSSYLLTINSSFIPATLLKLQYDFKSE